LDIDIVKIKYKFIAIMTQRGFDQHGIAQYDDMGGALLVFIIFGALLTLKGRLEFGNIYGFGLIGCLAIGTLINLLTPRGFSVEYLTCISILGYSLLPLCILAGTSVFYNLNGPIGWFLCSFMVFWCTITATKFFEYGLDMADKKYLIAYPIILFYSMFMLLTIF
jgi:protein YIPF5/7